MVFPVQRPGDFINAEWELFFFILPIFFLSRFHLFLTAVLRASDGHLCASCYITGLAQTGRQVANGDECRDLATKTMKWRHFWRQGEGLGPTDSKQVLRENRVFENSMNIKLFISLDRGHYVLCLLILFQFDI